MLQHIHVIACIENLIIITYTFTINEVGVLMRITVDKALKKCNRSRYWLSKEINCNYQSLVKLCNNESSAISFDLLERICTALNCTPNDLFDLSN